MYEKSLGVSEMKRRSVVGRIERPPKDLRLSSNAADTASPIPRARSKDGAKRRSSARRSRPGMELGDSAFIEHVNKHNLNRLKYSCGNNTNSPVSTLA